MSKLLDEVGIQAKVKVKIEGYGRLATFYQSNDTTSHAWYITPPRQVESLSAGGNAPQATHQCLVAAKDIPWNPQATLRMVDGKTSLTYRVVQVDPIDSGDLTQAYRMWMAR